MTSLVGRKAPDFTSAAVMPDGDIEEALNLYRYLDGHYGILFFYPLNFTFVCPSEILAYNNRADALAALDTKLISVSVDSQYSHYAWRNTPVGEGGLGPVKFPMVADITKQIARDYGVLIDDSVALRATFLIDRWAATPMKRCASSRHCASMKNMAMSVRRDGGKATPGCRRPERASRSISPSTMKRSKYFHERGGSSIPSHREPL